MNFVSLSKTVVSALSIFLSTVGLIERDMRSFDTNVEKPIDTVSLIVCTYNESPFIEQCIQSLKSQSVIQQYPDMFELIMVDSGSMDSTIVLAKPFLDLENGKDKLITDIPRGKLTARNMGTDISMGNIIVSVDADTFYHPHWLNTLLKSFQNPNTVAVTGSTFDYSVPNLPGQLYSLAGYVNKLFVRPKQMCGRNSAYYKHLYYLLGGFNENINQMSVTEMLEEEEYSFGKKLSQFGDVTYNISASCVHLGGLKLGCRTGLASAEVCKSYKIGIERFG